MTSYTLPSGGTSTSTGITLNNGDTLTVNSGGTAISTTVNSGGTAYVSAGGKMDSTSVNSSGFVYVSSGGVTTGTILSGLPNFVTQVFSSGTEVVFTGGSAINTTAFQAGKQIISGGMALDTRVTNGGTEDVLAGGTTTGTVAISGGLEEVLSGGSAVSVTVSTGGFEFVSSGGTAKFTTVSSGGNAETEFGGSAISATVNFGGFFTDLGSATATTVTEGSVNVEGTAIGTIVNAASVTVEGTGTTTGTMLNGFGNLFAFEDVVSGGVASDTTVNSAGYQVIGNLFGGGTAIGTMVDSFGFQYVSSGGTASNTQVNFGGEQVVSSGGTAIGTSVNSVGAELVVLSGAASGTMVHSSGVQYVYSGGSAADTTVSGGGFEDAYGTVMSTMVQSGGVEAVYSGSTVSDTLVESGGAIDLEALPFSSGGSVSLSPSDVLTVSVGGKVYTQQLTGNYTGEYFHLSDGTSVGKVGYGGTLVTLNGTPCYCRGTRILTDAGERAVEQLSIGDKVVTKSGETRSLRWIGRRSYSGPHAASHPEVLPVLIKQGALADELPRRDLWVSPLHAMFLNGMLVPAAALVNGISIVRAEAVEQLDYFHLELDTHDVIYAEGAMAESFVDDDSRGMFHNAAHYQRLYPQAVHEPARYCAPRVEEGAQLETLRRRLIERAQAHAGRAQTGRLLGYLDAVSRERIEGWAQDEATPNEPVSLRVLDNDIVIGQVLAERYREDLLQAGVGTGRHGFSLIVPGGLSPLVPHVIQVQRISDGQPLQPAPATV